VREHADTAAAQESEPVMEQDIESGLDARDAAHVARV